jgi:Recombination endonuclease VII
MPGRNPCPIGCTCGHHPDGKLPPGELERRAAEKRKDRYQANREAIIAKVGAYNKRPEVAKRRRVNSAGWSKKYRDGHRDEINARARAARDPAKDSVRRRNEKYGKGWAQLIEDQHGLCYMCDQPLDFKSVRAVHVDHDHGCCPGKRTCGWCILGISCHGCNTGAGKFGDDEDRMELAAARRRAAKAAVRRRAQERAELAPGGLW